MSDTHELWSAALPLAMDQVQFDEEVQWLRQALGLRDEDESPDTFVTSMRALGLELNDDFVAEFGWPGFEWAIEESPHRLHVHSEDQADLGNLAIIVRAFLRKFNPTAFFAVEWAVTCSDTIPGGFGGGAVVVTSHSIHWHNTSEWVARTVRKIREFDKEYALHAPVGGGVPLGNIRQRHHRFWDFERERFINPLMQATVDRIASFPLNREVPPKEPDDE